MDTVKHKLSARLDWTFSPRLSLQFHTAPYISPYDYFGLKEFRQPGKHDYDYYGKDIGRLHLHNDGYYVIDPDGQGPVPEFSVANQDFSFRSVRINVVLRWEFKPGSTLFVVWQQERDDYVSDADKLNTFKDYKELFHARAINTFVIKVSYWLEY